MHINETSPLKNYSWFQRKPKLFELCLSTKTPFFRTSPIILTYYKLVASGGSSILDWRIKQNKRNVTGSATVSLPNIVVILIVLFIYDIILITQDQH